VVHVEVQQAKRRWERWASATSAWIAGSSPGNDERERTKEIRRRNADRRNEYSAVANGHGRARSARRTHLSAFHRGSRPKESFIARDSAPGFLFLGLGGQFGWPSSGRYPPLPVPVQRTQSRPGHSAEGLMPKCRPGAGCKAARGHRTRPREPGMPPGRDRIIRRDSKPYVTITETFVNKTVTNSFRPSPAFFTTLLSSQTHSAPQSEILL